jgi:hypothetical protein
MIPTFDGGKRESGRHPSIAAFRSGSGEMLGISLVREARVPSIAWREEVQPGSARKNVRRNTSISDEPPESSFASV